ncbi:cobyrinate a,c-diamide synthase [Ectothiorhodospiraceae bacterium 2226]|nr:cobyrinate a,c-diamide synthase [Ectothiorhodospiraceae bacterium 2226]
MAHVLLSAAHKSSGKTTLAIGATRALAARGCPVQPFKKGPDYIDPIWLGRAAHRPCYNLDFNTMSGAELHALFAARLHAHGDALGLIEGNKGLHDGVALDGSNSNAALAALLDAPVALVVDARGMTRGVAPLVLGFQAFDARVRIGGVILNRVGGPRHEGKLRAALAHYTNIPVLGALPQDPALSIEERHLGLVPGNEDGAAEARIRTLAQRVAEHVDLDALCALAATARAPEQAAAHARTAAPAPRVRIGILRDSAFGFYYPDDLEALAEGGAEIVPIDSLHDARLPPLDGLFVGGGFPETHMHALQANAALRHAVRAAIEGGLPAYAECGGLMYLCRSLRWGERRAEMVGVIPAEAVMHSRPQGRGYVRLQESAQHPWPGAAAAGTEIAAHEFHYSRLEGLPEGLDYAYRVLRGTGIAAQQDGLVIGKLLANYAHLRHSAAYPWTQRFLAFVRAQRIKAPDRPGPTTQVMEGSA